MFENIRFQHLSPKKMVDSDYESLFDDFNIKENREELRGFLKEYDQLGDASTKFQQYMAKNNQGTSAFSKGLKTAGTALKSFGAALGSMAINWMLSEIVGYLFTIEQRAEEARQKTIEIGEEASKTNKELGTLVEQYRKLGEDGSLDNSEREKAYGIEQQINDLLGDEINNINLQNGSYEEQLKLLRDIQHQKANDNYGSIKDAKDAADKSLRKSAGVGTTWATNTFSINGGAVTTDKEAKEIRKMLLDTGFGNGQDAFVAIGDTSENLIKAYEDMISLRNTLSKSYTDEISKGGDLHDFYNELVGKIEDMSEAVQKYKDALANYNINEAIIQFNETDFSLEDAEGNVQKFRGSLIDSEDAMSGWIEAMLDAKDVSDGVQSELIALAKVHYPQYITQINAAIQTEARKVAQDMLVDKSISDNIRSLDSESKALGLTRLEMLSLITAEINFNKNNLDVSQKVAALKEVAVAAGIAQAKINGMFSVTGKSSMKDKEAWAKANGVKILYNADKDGTHLYEYKGQTYTGVGAAQGGITQYEIDSMLKNVSTKSASKTSSGGGFKSTGSGKSSSSSSKNEALDNYLKDAENRYKIHQDETKYINDLNYALQNLVKTKEEELDVTGKINEAYRDLADNRIKDLEHQNELLLNQGKTEKDLITNYKDIQKIASEEANRFRALGYDDNSNEIQALQKTWWDAENKIAEAPLSIVDSYDTVLSQIERKANEIDLQLQKAEANGLMASTRYYETMAKYETETLAKLREEKMALTNALNDAVNSGDIEVGTDAWYKMRESIDEVTESILSSEIALSEFNKKMKQIVSDRFDYFVDNFSRLTNEADYLIELLGEDLHTDNGQLNDKGITSAGLHGLNYNVYMEKALSYANELKRIEDEIASNPNDISLLERREQLLELQRESVLVAQDERQAIVDLVQQGIDVELNALQKLIDKYNESLDSAKDLYDYQKRIGEQADNIASLEKQLSAYEGDTSEETRAKVQQLKVQLESAKDNLKDTEYERYVGEQKKLLDDLYGDLEETLNEKIEDIDGIVENVIDKINSNSKTIANTLKSESAKYGSSISQEMKSVWTSEKQALNDYFGNGSSIGGFALGANGFFNGVGTNTVSGIVSVLTSISNDVNKILREASIVAQTGMDSETTKNQMIQNSKDWFIKDEAGRKELESENQKYGSALGYTYQNGAWYDSNGNIAYGVSTNEKISTIVSKMRQNGADWHVSSDSGKKQLEDENNRLAQQIENLSGKSVTKDSNGIWWIGNQELFKTYKTGGLVDYTGLAKLDGTPSKPELVLNAQDTQNFIALNDTLRNIQSQGLNLAALNHYSLADMVELPSIPDFSHLSQNKASSIGDVHINIEIDHVDDYNDLVNKMRSDKQFEKMIQSVSVDLLSGKSSLAKNRYKW